MDRFGAVFACGSAREIPGDSGLPPAWNNGPYFFPYLWAEDITVHETSFVPDMQ
jgi:hypothetical protein